MKYLNRYRVNLRGKAAAGSAAWMGLYFFLLVVHYFFLGHLFEYKGAGLFTQVILPLVLSGLFIALLKGVRLDFHPVYLGLLSALVLYLAVQDFSGNTTRAIVSLVWLVALLGVYACMLLKLLKGKTVLVLIGLVMPVYQLLGLYEKIFPFSLGNLVALLPEIGMLCAYLSVTFFAASLVPNKRNK